MELTIYSIIKRPLITTKSVDLYKKLAQYTFEVHTAANKAMVRDAIEKLWNVKVANVRIMNIAGKTKSFGRREYIASDRKKAIISLKQGYKIEIPGMFETMATQQPAHEKTEAEGS